MNYEPIPLQIAAEGSHPGFNIMEQFQREIATAMGIPERYLFSAAGGARATAVRSDDADFFSRCIDDMMERSFYRPVARMIHVLKARKSRRMLMQSRLLKPKKNRRLLRKRGKW